MATLLYRYQLRVLDLQQLDHLQMLLDLFDSHIVLQLGQLLGVFLRVVINPSRLVHARAEPTTVSSEVTHYLE